MRNQVWDTALAQLYPLDLSQLILRFLSCDSVHSEAALGVVDEAEVLACFFDRDDIHETGWVSRVGANLSIDLNKALHNNGLCFARVEGIL